MPCMRQDRHVAFCQLCASRFVTGLIVNMPEKSRIGAEAEFLSSICSCLVSDKAYQELIMSDNSAVCPVLQSFLQFEMLPQKIVRMITAELNETISLKIR